MPSWLSCSASLLAPCLVRVNTSTWNQFCVLIRCESSSRLRSRSTGCTVCVMISTVELRRATSISAGASSRLSASSLISSENVAENSRFCRFFGSSARMRLMSRMKPMSSIRSASSRTRISTRERSRLPWPWWSSSRPGRGDEDVDSALQLRGLRADADAAEDHHRRLLRVLAVDANAFLDLRRELARRREDQRADRLLRGPGAWAFAARASSTAAAASAARTRRSCRCRSARRRGGRRRRARRGSPATGSAWVGCSRVRSRRARARRTGRARKRT